MEEIEILNWIHDTFECVAFDYMSYAFEYVFKFGIIWFVAGLLLLRNHRTKLFGTVLITSIFATMLFTYMMKFAIDRPRPFEVYDVDALFTSLSSSSWPSSHTATLFCAAAVIRAFNKRVGIAVFALAFAVAFSRMYAYAHFPTDVLGGAIIGLAIGYYITFAATRITERTVFIASRTSGHAQVVDVSDNGNSIELEDV